MLILKLASLSPMMFEGVLTPITNAMVDKALGYELWKTCWCTSEIGKKIV